MPGVKTAVGIGENVCVPGFLSECRLTVRFTLRFVGDPTVGTLVPDVVPWFKLVR